VGDGWGCAEESATTIACSTACNRATEDCGEAQPPEGPDSGLQEMPKDAAVALDAGASPRADAIVPDRLDVTGPGQVDDRGCNVGLDGPTHVIWPLAFLFLTRRKRRTRRRSTQRSNETISLSKAMDHPVVALRDGAPYIRGVQSSQSTRE